MESPIFTGSASDSEFTADTQNNPFLSDGPPEKRIRPEKPQWAGDRFISYIAKENKLKYREECKRIEKLSKESLCTPVKTLSFQKALPTPPASRKHARAMSDLVRIMETPSKQSPYSTNDHLQITHRREVSRTPDMVLDAPESRDDYYCKLIDWSIDGNLLVGLGAACYSWNKVCIIYAFKLKE